MQFSKLVKKLLVASGIAIPLCFINVANLRAEGGTDYLAVIAQNTTNILEKVNNLPQYLDTMVTFALNWQSPDDSDSTATMQASFDALGQAFAQNPAAQAAAQQQVMADIVNKPITDFTLPATRPAILTALPNINELSYSSMIGAPPVAKGDFSPANFIRNASAGNLVHAMPKLSWATSTNPYQVSYYQYYNTVTAVESFSAYALTNITADSQVTNVQNKLIAQASSPKWLAQIAQEELGKVLRQILIFQSQTYVLLTQLLQTQKQLLTASVMTNSLIILNNRTNEAYLTAKAQGITPSS